ncbi:ATP-dependent dethiobiotin synthetase BioD 1 [Cedecea neteri]|uniref:ATP-dependent dethiobiotin synthetase BioD 1 n=1 Tax=Cedecea neteri TaxID=158822 RepID=A0A2X3L0E5_9ENTR|nr:ATP-dependent dethiobiotin synthetase BioD 1 [Cedecea neteri]
MRSAKKESSISHHGPINYSLLSSGLQRLSDQMDHVVVEGTGGWRSLMNDLRPLSDWVVQEQFAGAAGGGDPGRVH